MRGISFKAGYICSKTKYQEKHPHDLISARIRHKASIRETWIGFPPSARLEGDRVYTPRNRKKKKKK